MGANLDRLMKSYGVSTPTVSGYSGVAAPAALAAGATAEEKGTYASALAKYKNELDAYDRYAGDYKNRIATTDLYSSPYLNILPKSEQKYQTGNTITTPDYSALASPVTDINNIRTTPDYDSLVKAAYAGVGRSGIGSEGKNIDQAGYDYWSNQLKNNAISPADFKSTFSSSAKDYVAKNPNDPITNVMRNYRPANAENPMYDALIKSAYSGIGRSGVGSNMGNIDQPGYDYWMNQLNTGAVNPANFTSSFATGAKSYIDQNPDTDTSKYMRGYLGLSPAGTGGNGSSGSSSGNGSIGSSTEGVITEAMMAANPYLRAGYGDYNGRDQYVAEMAQGGPVRHFYGGGSNSIDGGITDLADKYALDNPAELPEIYAQAQTRTATDAAPASVAQRTVGGVVSPPSGSVPASDTTLQKLQASAVKVGEPPIQRGSPGPVEGATVRDGPESPRGAPAPIVAPPSADDAGAARYDKYFKPRPPSDAVIAARQSVADNRAALLKAINDQMGKSEENAPSKAEMYFRLAAAFAAPTKTGGFMENVGLAAKELGDFQKSTTDSKRAAAAARLQMLLKTNEITLQAAQEGLAVLERAQKEEDESRKAFGIRVMEEDKERRQPKSEVGRKLAEAGFVPGTPGFQAEMARVNQIEENQKAQTLAAQAARAARDKAEAEKLTPAEVKLKTSLDKDISTQEEALRQINIAIANSPNAFIANLPGIVERKIYESKNLFGGKADPKVTATERMETALGSSILQNAASMKGALSDKDMDFLLKLSGIASKSHDARLQLLEDAKDRLNREIARSRRQYSDVVAGLYREKTSIGGTE
jgi:hypothetical protein